MKQDHARIGKLIDAAAVKLGSDCAVAKATGYTRQNVSNWRHGQACPVEAQALMAAAAGLDANEVLTYAVIERAAGTKRGERLAEALGKGFAATSAVVFGSTFGNADWGSSFIRCIETISRRQLFRA